MNGESLIVSAASLPQVSSNLTSLLSGDVFCKLFCRICFPGRLWRLRVWGVVYAGVMKSAFAFARWFILFYFILKKLLFFSTVTSAGLDSFWILSFYTSVFCVWKSELGDLFGFLSFLLSFLLLPYSHFAIPSCFPHQVPKCRAFAASFLYPHHCYKCAGGRCGGIEGGKKGSEAKGWLYHHVFMCFFFFFFFLEKG